MVRKFAANCRELFSESNSIYIKESEGESNPIHVRGAVFFYPEIHPEKLGAG